MKFGLFSRMRVCLYACFIFIWLSFTACTGTQNTVTPTLSLEKNEVRPYNLLVKFSSEEGLKRVLLKFERNKMLLKEEVSVTDNIYLVEIRKAAFEIEGFVTKLQLEQDVEWAKLAEN